MSQTSLRKARQITSLVVSTLKFFGRCRHLALLLTGLVLGIPARASQSVTLGWNASADPAAVGYAVYYGGSSGRYTSRVDVGNNLSATIAGLTEGRTNYFTIAAYNSAGIEGPTGGEIVYMVPGLLHLTAGATRTSPVNLSFSAAPGHWYQIQASVDLKSWTNLVQTSVMTANSWISVPDSHSTQFSRRFYRVVQH